jgi:hypothetical protein
VPVSQGMPEARSIWNSLLHLIRADPHLVSLVFNHNIAISPTVLCFVASSSESDYAKRLSIHLPLRSQSVIQMDRATRTCAYRSTCKNAPLRMLTALQHKRNFTSRCDWLKQLAHIFDSTVGTNDRHKRLAQTTGRNDL